MSAEGQTIVMELDTDTLYSNRYKIKVEENLKAAKQTTEQIIEILETIDSRVKGRQ